MFSAAKGEISELKHALQDKHKCVEALKHIVASMTLGKDVSALFPDVLQAMHTQNIEQKKLVYLYLMNYARRSPQLALMSVQQFTKDSTQNPDPLIRGLAIRTMGCMRVENMIQYLGEPLRKALKDENPYVRKTAAICVAKLYEMDPELVDEQGFLQQLEELLSDSNSVVIANAVAALQEITAASGNSVLKLNSEVINKLLLAMNDCSEWGQVFIFDSIANYQPTDLNEAKMIVQRISTRLKHANSAVVLGAIKILLNLHDQIRDADFQKSVVKLLGPPLITLLSSNPEVQYVALRNINLIIRKFPKLLQRDVRMFFRKYNDPIYVKMEKLEIMILLSNSRNADKILSEFQEYCMDEVDIPFVRKCVSAIGRVAIKVDSCADRAISVLFDLVEAKKKATFIVQEAIVVMRDIFRRYPGRYEKLIGKLFPYLDSIDLPEAKSAMIWIVGEYSDGINKAGELLQQFSKNFEDEMSIVQLQILTAAVKVLLNNPSQSNEQFLHKLLSSITQKMDNPDLRDRAAMYWRLLAIDSQAAAKIILSKKPTIQDDSTSMEPHLLKQLLQDLGSLSSVFHKPASTFVPKTAAALDDDEDDSSSDDEDYEQSAPNTQNAPQPVTATTATPVLADIGGETGPTKVNTTLPIIIPATPSHKVQVGGQFVYNVQTKQLALKLELVNSGQIPITSCRLSFNKNFFGLQPNENQVYTISPPSISTGHLGTCAIPLSVNPQHKINQLATSLELALKTDAGVALLKIGFPLQQFIIPSQIEGPTFIAGWQSLAQKETKFSVSTSASFDSEIVKATLASLHLFFVTQRGANLFYYLQTFDSTAVFLIVTVGEKELNVAVRGNPALVHCVNEMFHSTFK